MRPLFDYDYLSYLFGSDGSCWSRSDGILLLEKDTSLLHKDEGGVENVLACLENVGVPVLIDEVRLSDSLVLEYLSVSTIASIRDLEILASGIPHQPIVDKDDFGP